VIVNLNLSTFLEPFIVLFGLIAVGALVARLRILDGRGVSQISSLVVNVTLPAAIFLAVAAELSLEVLRAAPLVVALGVGLGVLTWGLGRLTGGALGLGPGRRPVFSFAAGCGNTGFLGIPLVAALLGPGALVAAVLYDFGTTINIFTFGVAGLDRSASRLHLGRLVRNLLNPMFLALVIGVAWAVGRVPLPGALREALEITGDATTPLAMFALGHMLYAARREAAPGRDLAVLAAIRLVLAPALMLGAVWALPLPDALRAVCVLQAGMPTAMLTALLAQQYEVDAAYGVQAAVGTTLASLATIPLVALGVGALWGAP
jgi:predicted permease